MIFINIIDFIQDKTTPSFLQSRSYKPEYTVIVPSFEGGIDFSSKFENANLKKAIRVSKCEYELYLNEDYNTKGHYHWFYFKTNACLPAKTEVWFTIMNMIKPSSLYSVGFRPYAYSVKKGSGWIPAGDSISYTPIKTSIGENIAQKYYSLKWKYTYEYDNDEVYFVQFVPYTYSDLLNYLRQIKNSKNESIMRLDILCKTLAKNVCPMITITDKINSYLSYRYERELAIKSKNTKKMILSKIEKLPISSITKKTKKLSEGKYKNEISLYDSDLNKFRNLEIAIKKHKKYHENKKGIIITARVHPGKYKDQYRGSSKFLGG